MTAPFRAYVQAHPGARFTEWLRDGAEPAWAAAVGHRFTQELATDTLGEAAFRRYLVQDFAFLAALASLVGFAVGHAPSMAEKARLAEFLTVLTGGESDYFERAFEALGVSESVRRSAECGPATRGLAALFAEAAGEGYDEVMAVLVPVEWIYLSWATDHVGQHPSRFYYAEWIALHADPTFRDFVEWMRGELDRRGPALPPARQARLADLFTRACAFEVAFFDEACYAG